VLEHTHTVPKHALCIWRDIRGVYRQERESRLPDSPQYRPQRWGRARAEWRLLAWGRLTLLQFSWLRRTFRGTWVPFSVSRGPSAREYRSDLAFVCALLGSRPLTTTFSFCHRGIFAASLRFPVCHYLALDFAGRDDGTPLLVNCFDRFVYSLESFIFGDCSLGCEVENFSLGIVFFPLRRCQEVTLVSRVN
jgi:hypothetical protein